MVFQGGWRSRRRNPGQGPQDPGYGPGYGPGYDQGYGPGYGGGGYGRRFGSNFGNRRGYNSGYGGGNGSCLRDMLLVEGGCCLAESLGCGPSLALMVPSVGRRMFRRRPAPAPSRPHPHGRVVDALLDLIETYQSDVSTRRPARCRFTPTCSHYTAEALREHGLARGGRLAAGRLLRCRPGARGGDDPVPSARAA